jgi:hypothetical protein
MTAVPTELEGPTIVRAPTQDELQRFVWETSLKVRQPRGISWTEWETGMGNRLLEALASPASVVRVAEDQGTVCGFAHWLDGVLQMLYVKAALRGHGYGLDMLLPVVGPVLVHAPNACWRRWAYAKSLRWRES